MSSTQEKRKYLIKITEDYGAWRWELEYTSNNHKVASGMEFFRRSAIRQAKKAARRNDREPKRSFIYYGSKS